VVGKRAVREVEDLELAVREADDKVDSKVTDRHHLH
jgi:hypothetical protein